MPCTASLALSGKLMLINRSLCHCSANKREMISGACCSAVAHLTGWPLRQPWLSAIAGTLNRVASIAAAIVPE
jgi:hypothetical protein